MSTLVTGKFTGGETFQRDGFFKVAFVEDEIDSG
jgi:hypothetical protein